VHLQYKYLDDLGLEISSLCHKKDQLGSDQMLAKDELRTSSPGVLIEREGGWQSHMWRVEL